MSVRRFGPVVGVVLGVSGCGRSDPPPAPPVLVLPEAPAPPEVRATGTTASAASGAHAPLPRRVYDFEDAREYGVTDAGAGDPSRLKTRPGYKRYGNERFAFSLDVPRALDAMEPPGNGDGQQWRLGELVMLTASGIHWNQPAPMCPSSASVVAHRETATTCWATGTRDGYTFWEKAVLAHGVEYSLRFQYRDELKAAMDPIVAHVDASWRY